MMPCLRQDLDSVCTDLMRKVSVLRAGITWLPFNWLTSAERNQTLRVQTVLFSSPWFLGLAACFVTPRDIVQRWQYSSLKGEM